MITQAVGLRSYAPSTTYEEIQPITRSELLQAAKLAGKALNLSGTVRFILTQLCAVFGNQLVEDKILVCPSNEYLCESSGVAERTVRYALRKLIDHGVVNAKDSANGKRFAQRDQSGKVIKAYGFDLNPMVARLEEFHKIYFATYACMSGGFKFEVRLDKDNNALSHARSASWSTPIRILIWMNVVK